MLKYIEELANSIVDYMDWAKRKSKLKKAEEPIKEIDSVDTMDYVFYKIVPYNQNVFWSSTFKKLLSTFSYYTDRINFFVYWNNSQAHLVVSFPNILEKKFITTFYNFFPSSKIIKIEETNFNFNQFIYTIWNDPFKLKDNKKDFFKDLFFLFKDIPSNEKGVIRYSLVMNSTWEVEYEWLFELIWRGIKLFFWAIYYFFYQVFLWKPPKKRILSKKQQLKTWIKWTAISVATGWNSAFNWLAFNYFEKNLDFDLYKQDTEVFSKMDINYFSDFFHIPTKNEKIELLTYINYKRLAPPPNLPKIDKTTTILWNADWADENIKVWLKQEDKARHVYIIWKTWVGKSTLLSNMIFSDVNNKSWFALIDPHGDLVNTVLRTIPEERADDVVLFDVSDTSNIIGFNPFYELSNLSEEEREKNKDLVVSSVLSVFKKLYGYSWWPRLEYILRNVLLTLADYPDANFLDIVKILTDKNFRKKVIAYTKDEVIKNFWEKEFAKRSERFSSEAISPILNKVWQFISSPIIRNIFWQQKTTINIKDIMDSWKILLVNLSKWLIWEDNSALIGSFIVSQIQVETMKRAGIATKDRRQFTLYIDEFQNFATESFSVILSEARKYNLALVVANQYINQIDESIQNAIFGNIWNLVAFQSGNKDAEILAKQFKNKITSEDIASIPRFKAYSKIMIDWESTDVFGLSTYPIPDEIYQPDEVVARLKAISNKKYTKPKNDVKKEISDKLWTVDVEWLIKKQEDNNNLVKSKNNSLSKKSSNLHLNTEEWKEDNNKITNWNKKIQNDNLSIEPKISDNSSNSDIGDIYDGIVKLKFNYGLFVITDKYEWLLHKKNIKLPEWINWKDYYNIWDKVRVKLIQLKEVDGQVKAVWETVR